MKSLKLFGIILLSVAVMAGCAHKPFVPVHDEVLVYPLSYDVTYLRVLDAMQHTTAWSLEMTEKENGIIRVRNMDYDGLDDSERRVVTFLVKRLGRGQTSVALAPDSQQVIGGGDLIKLVSDQLGREVKARG